MVISNQKLRLLLKDCANGFYQQMYFLGKDVIHPQGNLLQEYGFIKTPSQGLKGTSCYTLKTKDFTIELYGSCAAYYSKSSRVVFIRKRGRFYHWLPDHKLIAGQWSQDDLRQGDAEELHQALIPLLQWWLDYEAWISEKFPSTYRGYCFSEWQKVKSKAHWLAPELATKWVDKFINYSDDLVRPKNFVS